MPMIHVIIPCYNVEEYLTEAVNSVLNQPVDEIDVILVDDGSPGATPALCDALAAQNSRVHVIHKTNGGVSNARNAGIDYVLENLVHSKREFIAFLDGDDLWCPNVVDDRMIQHLLNDWNEDVIGFSGVTSNNSLTRFSGKVSTPECSHVSARSQTWESQIVHFSAKLYCVDVFKTWGVRFQPNQAYSEDKAFMILFYSLAESARVVDQTLHVYRKNKKGAMGSMHKLSAQDYYLPIIDGWLKCDEFLNELSDRTGYTSTAGQSLAAIYLVEMVAVQMKKWGSFREIMTVFRAHPHYPAVESGELVRHNPREYPINRLLFEHPLRFRMQYRMRGAAEWVLWQIFRIPMVAELWEKKRFPLTQIPK